MKAGLAALVCLTATAGCGVDIGPSKPWVAIEDIDGLLRPEQSPPPASAMPGRDLRLTTYNVEYGEDVDALASALAGRDILFIQEIDSFPGEGRSRAARLAEALAMGYVYAPARPKFDGTHGIAILSRFPLENAQVMELPFADLMFGGRRRIALSADLRVGDVLLKLICVHLDTSMNATDRIVQLRPAVLEAPTPVIVAGDFNTNAYLWLGRLPDVPAQTGLDADQSIILDDYMAALGFQAPTASFGQTITSTLYRLRLDSIFIRGLSGDEGGVDRDVTLSDHYPLWLNVHLP